MIDAAMSDELICDPYDLCLDSGLRPHMDLQLLDLDIPR